MHQNLALEVTFASIVRIELGAHTCEGASASRLKKPGVRLYPCKGGYVAISAAGDAFWPGLVKMMDNPAWTKEEWCQDRIARAKNSDKVTQMMIEWTKEHTAEEIYYAAIVARIPCSPVRTMKELVNDEQLAVRDFFVEIAHPEAGTLKYPGAPYKLSATPWEVRHSAPLLGEHNEQVYCKMLGYSRQDLVKMRQAGVI